MSPAKSPSQKKLFNIALGMKRGDIPKTNTTAGKISQTMKESKIKEFTKSNKVDPEDNNNYEYGNGGEVQLKPENRIDAAEYKYGRKGEVSNSKVSKSDKSWTENRHTTSAPKEWKGETKTGDMSHWNPEKKSLNERIDNFIEKAEKVFSDPQLQKVHEEGGISLLKKSSYHPLHQQSFKTSELAGRKLSNLGAKHQKTIKRDSGNITRVYNHPQHGVFTTVDSGKKTKILHYPMHKSVDDFEKAESLRHNGEISDPKVYRANKFLREHNITSGNAHLLKPGYSKKINKSVESDLKTSKKEEDKAIMDYDKRAEKAEAEGDKESANFFRELSRDETQHAAELEGKLVKDINNFIEKTKISYGIADNPSDFVSWAAEQKKKRETEKQTKVPGMERFVEPPINPKNKGKIKLRPINKGNYSFGGRQNKPGKDYGSSVERQVEAGKTKQKKTDWNSFLGGRSAERPGSKLPKSGERTYKSKDDKLANYMRKDPVTRSMNRNIDRQNKKNIADTKRDSLFRQEYPKDYKGPDLINSIDNFIEKQRKISVNDISMAEHRKDQQDLKNEVKKLGKDKRFARKF